MTFSTTVTITDAADNEFEVEVKVYEGCSATRWEPADPGEVEIGDVYLNGDKVNGQAVDDLVAANQEYIEEQAWDMFMDSQDDYEESDEPDYPEHDDFYCFQEDY
jgi:hypothetical protein